MKKLAFILMPGFLFLCSLGPSTQVDNFSYTVFIDDQTVGTYTVSRTEVNEILSFRVEANTAAGLIRRSEFKSVMLSSYKNSKLVSSDIKRWVDQKLESSSALNWDGEQYLKREGDKLSELCFDMINYSSACVFFEEPNGRTSLFYEEYGTDLQVVSLGNHQYEVQLPNGSTELYTYEDGRVASVQISHSFATTTLKAKS